jgi:hypothetical protein
MGIMRHRQTKGPGTDRPRLTHRVTPRLYALGMGWRRTVRDCELSRTVFACNRMYLLSNPENQDSQRGIVIQKV